MSTWGKVISIEAQQPSYYALCGNIALNNCWNIEAIWAVVSDHNGYVDMPVLDITKPANVGGLSLLNEFNAQQDFSGVIKATKKTPVITIDSLNLQRLDFLKIDVQGLEIEVVKGAMETIKRCKPIIVVEANNPSEDWKFLPYPIGKLNNENYMIISG